MELPGVEPVADVSVGEWIAPRLGPFGGHVCSVVPDGFQAYARVLHPAVPQTGGHHVRWSEVCGITGRTPHALMQWDAIAGVVQTTVSRMTTRTSLWPGEPRTGELEPASLVALLDVLAAFTTATDNCYHALWDGYGFLPEARPDVWAGPRLRHPHRDYLVFRGPLIAALGVGWRPAPDWFLPQAPNIIWPVDQAWCVASEIDFDSTLVGGSGALIASVLAEPRLEAWSVRPEDDLGHLGDAVNGPARET
ncbi:MAG: hypothetical protein ABI912_04090 [Actinomycetota bacterium]